MKLLNIEKNNYLLMVLLAAVFTLANYTLTLHRESQRLEGVAEIANMRSDVNNDFVNELIWSRFNDFETYSSDMLVSQGRIEGVIDYINNDNSDYIDNLWHEGYQRGVSQVDFEREVIANSNFDRGYVQGKNERIFSVFEDINISPRKLEPDAILMPEFDNSSDLPENSETIEALNKKINEIRTLESFTGSDG
jgi:hypothetical protein